MADDTMANLPRTKVPLSEQFVQGVEEMSPAIPLVGCLLWGMVLVLLSFVFHLASFPVGSKSLGWVNELNWSSTFGFFIPFSLFFSCSTFTAIPQVITALADGQMIRGANGELADTDALIASWRRRAGKTTMIVVFLAAMAMAVSWNMAWIYCINLDSLGVASWQHAILLGAPGVNRSGLAIFGFLAYTSQGLAIACFCYYIMIIFTFANWIHDYTKFGKRDALYPDITEADSRYGFERFGPIIENILLASLAYFFQFFMTRLFYVYVDDPNASSMSDVIARALGRDFGHDVTTLFNGNEPSLFDFGSTLHFENTIMSFAMLIVVISAIIVPMVIVRNAADRSRVRLQEAIQKQPDLAKRWYELDASEAQHRLDKMTVWPIRYARPVELLLLIILATACFFAYKLFLLLAAFIIYQGARLFARSFRQMPGK